MDRHRRNARSHRAVNTHGHAAAQRQGARRGRGGNSGYLSVQSCSDPATGIWTATGLATARYSRGHVAAQISGKVLVAGDITAALLFSPVRSWNNDPVEGHLRHRQLTTARQLYTATLLPNSSIIWCLSSWGRQLSRQRGVIATGDWNQRHRRPRHRALIRSHGHAAEPNGKVPDCSRGAWEQWVSRQCARANESGLPKNHRQPRHGAGCALNGYGVAQRARHPSAQGPPIAAIQPVRSSTISGWLRRHRHLPNNDPDRYCVANGSFQSGSSALKTAAGMAFTVLTTTDLSSPLINWTVHLKSLPASTSSPTRRRRTTTNASTVCARHDRIEFYDSSRKNQFRLLEKYGSKGVAFADFHWQSPRQRRIRPSSTPRITVVRIYILQSGE